MHTFFLPCSLCIREDSKLHPNTARKVPVALGFAPLQSTSLSSLFLFEI